MQREHIAELAYLVAIVLFIYGIKLLTNAKTARRGNALSSVGMLVAIVSTAYGAGIVNYTGIAVAMIVGSVIGGLAAGMVQMTSMPQMVALFNGFGGMASFLVAYAEHAKSVPDSTQVIVSVALSVLIGAITFTGSVVAFAKLQGLINSAPLTYKGQQLANVAMALAVLGLIWGYTAGVSGWVLGVLGLLSLVLGVTLVIPIGGADMPVVISLLNSYSGLAACATGFVLSNRMLIVTGSLVGASGIILTAIMCKAMNRSLANVLFSAFGTGDSKGVTTGEKRSVRRYDADDAAMVLEGASNVVIVPGYGLAVAQAQHITRDLGKLLEEKGTTVKYAIHPVAGRMPGHMNVLLAEAEVPYEKLITMEDINPEFENTDVVLILGANDVVNPIARQPGNPMSGMPILDVDKARTVMIVKRSLSPGFAGIDNPLFYEDKTMMLFGDAKAMVTSLVKALNGA